MKILAIESSCDETAVAVVEDGKKVLSNAIYTQIEIHKLYGGVVPEIASRHHIAKITYVIDQALKEANVTMKDIDYIAVTGYPGLVGSLMVGINAAKTLAMCYDLPIVFVDHIVGHIYANYLTDDFNFPVIALVVSGGHTELVLMEDHLKFKVLGETLDDAVGEAYDKIARVVDVGYPGGPIIDNMAKEGKPVYSLPHIKLAKDSYDFSFSGLKSAVINLANKAKEKNEELNKNDLAASFQDAVVDVLVSKTKRATEEFNTKQVIVAGGVAANKGLRKGLNDAFSNTDVKVTFPEFKYCTDNAAMIGAAAYFMIKNDKQGN